MSRRWFFVLVLLLSSCTGAEPRRSDDHPGTDSEPHVIATIEIGRSYSIAAGPTGIWSANYEDGEVVRVDPETNEVEDTIRVRRKLGAGVSSVHPVEGHVWLSASDSATVGHLDPKTLELEVAATAEPIGFLDMTASPEGVWLAEYSGSKKFTPRTSHGVRISSANLAVPPPGNRFAIYSDIAAGDAGVWATSESNGTLAAISDSPEAPRVVREGDEVIKAGASDVAVGHGAVWLIVSDDNSEGDSRVARFDPSTFDTKTMDIEGLDASVAFGPDSVWVLTHDDEDKGFLYELDPETLEALGEPLTLEGEFGSSDIAYGFGSVWISHDFSLLTRIATEPDPQVPVAAPSPLRRGDGDMCDSGGPWSDCREAAWLYRVIHDAGFEVVGDTGSAFKVDAGADLLYAWNTLAEQPVEELAQNEGYEQVSDGVYSDGTRIVWEAQGFHIYLESRTEASIDGLREAVVQQLVHSSQDVPTKADTAGAKPQPKPTGEQRFDTLGNGKIRTWPVTEDVTNQGKYLFIAPHCGLDWMTDFDGSFWDPVEPDDYGNGDRYSFFFNSDEGVITFVDDDTATYQASSGQEVELRRIEGPIEIHPCE